MERCEVKRIHPDAVDAAAKALEDAPIEDLAQLFKILGDPTRVKILLALGERELCVCDLTELFDLTPSAISHQLRLLRVHRLVKVTREGKLAYYQLDDHHVRSLFEQGLSHVKER